MLASAEGERHPVDATGSSIPVARLTAGEAMESLKPPSGKARSEHACTKPRTESVTEDDHHAIEKSAAGARWR
jgi:hypothetical protein